MQEYFNFINFFMFLAKQVTTRQIFSTQSLFLIYTSKFCNLYISSTSYHVFLFFYQFTFPVPQAMSIYFTGSSVIFFRGLMIPVVAGGLVDTSRAPGDLPPLGLLALR